MLIILSGRPATGKTSIARELARQLGGVHLRIDSIEQAIRDSPSITGLVEDAGYRVGYAVTGENLRLGRTVIADSVNPLKSTRDAWVEVANRAGVHAVEVEVQCTDRAEHHRRTLQRIADISGLRLPSWIEVESREYDPWDRDHVVVDTAGVSVEQCVRVVRSALPHR